ncbi:MAG: hypothetical protein ACJAUH_002562 [Saprospiraceae bacterium]|jgi:hypothetical protein
MKIKLRIQNLSNKIIQVSLEPTGDFQNLSKNDGIVLELEKVNDGQSLDLLIYDDELMFAENNDVFIHKPENTETEI